jgi:hypothetical protein
VSAVALGSRIARVAIVAVVSIVVIGIVFLLVRSDERPAEITLVEAQSDSTEMSVTVQHRGCRSEPKVSVDEDDTDVTLRASYDESGDCDDVKLESVVPVALDRPLGTRAIVVRTVDDGSPLTCIIDGEASNRCERG